MVQSKTFKNLYNASLKLLSANSLNETYKIISDCSRQIVNAKYCFIKEVSNGISRISYSSDKKLNVLFNGKNDKSLKIYGNGKATLFSFRQLDMESGISVPLLSGVQKFGTLTVLSPKGQPFNEDDLETMNFFANLVSFTLKQMRLKEKLKEAVDDRDLFISIVAHEIRNPLTLLQAYAELITRYASKGIQPNQDLIAKVKTSIRRVSNLISEFLSLHQIKSGTIRYEFNKEDLKKILEEAVDNFRFQYPHHTIKFNRKKYDEFYPVYADSEKMQLVLLNILKNAGKFSSPKEPITVSLANHYGKVLLKISDKGKGISKEDMEHIFDKYFTKKENGKGGMGLGLFLSKNILAAHHGSIEIKSAKDAGTSVMIELPDYAHGKKKKHSKNKKIKR